MEFEPPKIIEISNYFYTKKEKFTGDFYYISINSEKNINY